MKIVNTEEIKIDSLISVSSFIKELVDKTGNDKISAATIHYHLNNTDKLDYIEKDGVYYIVKNEKYLTFEPGKNYNTPRKSTISFTK